MKKILGDVTVEKNNESINGMYICEEDVSKKIYVSYADKNNESVPYKMYDSKNKNKYKLVLLNPSQQDEFETIKFNYESYKNNNKSVVMCKSIHNDTDKYLAFDDDNVYFMKDLIKINM